MVIEDSSHVTASCTATVVRPMRAQEAAEVSRFVLAAFDEFMAKDFDDWGKAGFAKFASPEALLARQAYGYLTLVAEVEGCLAGLIQVRWPSHIVALFVRKEYQGRGIGRALVTEAVRRIEMECPEAEFVTVVSSPHAVGFYQRLGFETVYADGARGAEHGMRLPLTSAADPEH
ncbi:GNAT family N-acetyltransferase [Pelomicrobium methylotrophicum]|uniref:GNAT family N-acetyltransferase n=1 Tax=Pelomicrobium methylotrophicum TaxID=2602750 RepID=A0A5C7EZC6_9PROT|nr:GNAT family N-acetyltransferase [Pelomicrobium methylotrophicum]TXF13771.1 GNAT family N-acetyltransferase [Pelomicrobium methylotrophicum]